MVVTCNSAKMTDPECEEQGWTHAYVMGLENIGGKSWGDVTIDEPDIANITTGGTFIEENMNGYFQTQTILAAHSSELKDKYAAFNLIKEYRDKNIIPNNGVCSPWFMPSIGQWFDLLVNICGRNPREFEYRSIYNLETHKYGTETLIPLSLAVWLVINKVQSINLDPQAFIGPIESFAALIRERTGYDVLANDNLSSVVSFLPRLGQALMGGIGSFAVNVFVLIFVLYFMLIGGDKMENYVNDLLPFNSANKKHILR